jgi:ABC-2 type transport system permease protein
MNALALSSPLAGNAREPMPIARIARAYLVEAKFEFVRMLRSPIFVVPFVVLPVALFLLFGVLIPVPPNAQPQEAANFLFGGFATFAVLGPALFAVGCPIAVERDQGLLKFKRALPAPPASYLVAKVLMQLAFAIIGAGSVSIAALLVGKISLSVLHVACFAGVLVLGTIPFCAIGLFIGTRASGSAAPGFTNLLFFPMIYLSGLFFPLPKALAPWAVVWPTFHLEQLAFAAAGLTKFQFFPPLMSLGALVGVTVLFGGLAIRRLVRVG